MTYGYDSNGNLLTKTDARSATTAFVYDLLNRPTQITYSALTGTEGYAAMQLTSSVYYKYDDNQAFPSGAPANFDRGKAVGRLVATTYGSSGNGDYFGYDELGRVVRKTQMLDGTPYPIQASYNRASMMSGETYPSTRTISYSFDQAGRLSTFTGTLGDGLSRTYASVTQYNAASLKECETFGTGTNGMTTPLYLKLKYNNRFQMVDARLANQASTNVNVDWNRGKLMFFYGANAVTNNDPLLNSTTNNGNVIRSAHYVPTTVDGSGNISASVIASRQDYAYDDLNRIASVIEQQVNTAGSASTSASQGFGYDRYGNRTINAVTGPVNGQSLTFNQTTNRINMAGYVYDLAGNLTNQSGGARTYDAENRMVSATGGSYVYDGDGKRVKRTANSQTWCYVYGIGGELLAEYLSTTPAAGSPQKEYGYRAGQMLVVWDTSQTGDKKWKWLVTDHLGSTRMETDKGGTLAGITRHDYLPFGEELFSDVGSVRSGNGYEASPPTTNVRKKFGTYERDSETGLDFAGARYYASMHGRFTSPDPLLLTDGRLTDPQRINLYNYTRNSPLSFVDPSGLDITLTGSDDDIKRYLAAIKEKTGLNLVRKDGKLAFADGKRPGKLKGDAAKIADAIESSSNTEISLVRNNGSVDFGTPYSLGHQGDVNKSPQLIDYSDIDVANQAGLSDFNEASIVLHETLEAIYIQNEGLEFSKAHGKASKSSPGIESARGRPSIITWDYAKGWWSMTVTQTMQVEGGGSTISIQSVMRFLPTKERPTNQDANVTRGNLNIRRSHPIDVVKTARARPL